MAVVAEEFNLTNYDIIGDVHGCAEELDELLIRLGYTWESDFGIFTHPLGNIPVFVGDLVDRGPDSASVLSLSMNLSNEQRGLFVLGNHEDKLLRALKGNKVKIGHTLSETIKQIRERGDLFVSRVISFLSCMPWKLKLHDSRVLICHAGLAEKYHDRDDDAARSKALYGDTTGEKDYRGYPIRLDWADHYKGPNIVVHGLAR